MLGDGDKSNDRVTGKKSSNTSSKEKGDGVELGKMIIEIKN